MAPSQAPEAALTLDLGHLALDLEPCELDLGHLALDLDPWELDLKPWELDLAALEARLEWRTVRTRPKKSNECRARTLRNNNL